LSKELWTNFNRTPTLDKFYEMNIDNDVCFEATHFVDENNYRLNVTIDGGFVAKVRIENNEIEYDCYNDRQKIDCNLRNNPRAYMLETIKYHAR
jgi:hypothetical protein